MTIAQRINGDQGRELLTNCCAATAWVDAMLARRPFANDDAVLTSADAAAQTLGETDWLEAFAAHPLIGDIDSLRARYAATRGQATGEQSGVAGADEQTLAELARLNRAYLEKFGFIFIVCATGKSADQMLAILRDRIGNARPDELRHAAQEQLKITRLRLHKLAAPG
ncbi:MAG TPA: 2-oxo-4-hydroxy-4-carboxy-5-ureidoimidazoline decarboxylase [Lacipirellulaceae bacterium]|nr:2-oxo-4-hydroxy-4-carboxy-5-ureidoimidazoline decarboxylase [Lacipirellulaceae bacterium]